jgi:ribonuclease P protein component
MISRSQRINLEQFNLVMEKGKIVHSSLFLARILDGKTETRIAAIAPKKVAKTAVGRNKIRRKIYEAVRKLNGEISSGSHILIFAKSNIVNATQVEVVIDLKILFVKAGLLR